MRLSRRFYYFVRSHNLAREPRSLPPSAQHSLGCSDLSAWLVITACLLACVCLGVCVGVCECVRRERSKKLPIKAVSPPPLPPSSSSLSLSPRPSLQTPLCFVLVSPRPLRFVIHGFFSFFFLFLFPPPRAFEGAKHTETHKQLLFV